jgi:hypothetical protein
VKSRLAGGGHILQDLLLLLLLQGRIAGRLGSAARTLTHGLAYVPVSSLGVCRVSERR